MTSGNHDDAAAQATEATGADRPRPAWPPSVDAVARAIAEVDLPHPLLVDAARAALDEARADGFAADHDAVIARAGQLADLRRRTLLRPVVNATGVLLHTNLGRAPLAHHQDAGATNLELDLTTGARGSRRAHAGTLLARAAGAEAGLVVNNGAAAVLLVLAALARGRGVAVSRGELVEIGGGFRVPEVLAESGARLVEVGTTNRTRLADYERACADPAADVALALQVHRSNYRIVGFTEDVATGALAGLPVPVVVDLGSGLLDAACPWLPDGPPAWLREAGEPAVRQTLEAGAGLVVFSGDKLLGGPQAGVVVGRADLVDACARHPLARALRPGGLVLAALQEVALAYLGRDGDAVPFWRQATTPVAELRARAGRLADGLAGAPGRRAVTVVELAAVPGGGTLPGVEIPSAGLRVDGDVTAALRSAPVPVIARVNDGATWLDLRTVSPADDELVADALGTALAGTEPAG